MNCPIDNLSEREPYVNRFIHASTPVARSFPRRLPGISRERLVSQRAVLHSLLGLLCVSAALGCDAHGSATGKLEAKGALDIDASASVDVDADGRVSADAEGGIKFIRDEETGEERLDYEGEILFEYNKADLRLDDKTTHKSLKSMKAYLRKHREVEIVIEGHTDSRGSQEYNRDLSDRRAAAVREWLVATGIDGDRLESVGKGEDEPKTEEPEECHNSVPADTSDCEGPWRQNPEGSPHFSRKNRRASESIDAARVERA